MPVHRPVHPVHSLDHGVVPARIGILPFACVGRGCEVKQLSNRSLSVGRYRPAGRPAGRSVVRHREPVDPGGGPDQGAPVEEGLVLVGFRRPRGGDRRGAGPPLSGRGGVLGGQPQKIQREARADGCSGVPAGRTGLLLLLLLLSSSLLLFLWRFRRRGRRKLSQPRERRRRRWWWLLLRRWKFFGSRLRCIRWRLRERGSLAERSISACEPPGTRESSPPSDRLLLHRAILGFGGSKHRYGRKPTNPTTRRRRCY